MRQFCTKLIHHRDALVLYLCGWGASDGFDPSPRNGLGRLRGTRLRVNRPISDGARAVELGVSHSDIVDINVLRRKRLEIIVHSDRFSPRSALFALARMMFMQNFAFLGRPHSWGRQILWEAMGEVLLNREPHLVFRSVVARGNFRTQDRPDIRCSVKELCRRMSSLRECDWIALIRLGRYWKGRPRLVQSSVLTEDLVYEMDVYVGQELPSGSPQQGGHVSGSRKSRARLASIHDRSDSGDVHVMVGSDWAGCRETIRSTSRGCMVYKGVCLKLWSSTQHHLAFSSGETEYSAAVQGGVQGLLGKPLPGFGAPDTGCGAHR